MQLGSAVIDAERAQLAQDQRDRRVLRHAERTAQLRGAVGHAMQGLRHEHLGHGRLGLHGQTGIHAAGAVQRHHAAGMQVDVAVGHHRLHLLQVGQPVPERAALVHVVAGEGQRAAGAPQQPHAVRQPGRLQPLLRIDEALPHLAQHGVVRDVALVEAQLAMAADGERIERGNGAHQLHAGVVHRHDELRGAVIGLCEHDGEAGADRARDEPLVAVDHPAVTRAAGAAAQHGGIRSRTGRRLRHGEAGPDAPLRKRPQPRLALRGRALAQQADHVGLVGRGAVQRCRAQVAATGLLEDGGALFPVQAQAALRLGQLRQVEACRLRQRAQFGERGVNGRRAMHVRRALARDALGIDEGAHARREVARHAAASRSTCLAMFSWWIWLVPSYRRNSRTSRKYRSMGLKSAM